MKKYRTMITFLAIFVVLVGLYFFMNYVNKVQAENALEFDVTALEAEEATEEEKTEETDTK